MADNRYTNRPGDIGESNELNEDEIVLNILREEFPEDTLVQEGRLSNTQDLPRIPVDELASRNPNTQLLELDADVSQSFAEYGLNKLVPGITDEALDDVLEDEFLYYLSPVDTGFRPPARSGLFLISVELDTTPYDWHDLYIRQGPERIPQMLADGMDEDDILRNIFCVWYIERDVARPIPNYKTLEVMLAERGKGYGAIGEASENEMQEFDMRLDGRFEGYATRDEFGNTLEPPGLFDEFISRTMLDRSREYNNYIRYKAGYQLGFTSTGKPFSRDPGDYIRPEPMRRDPDLLPPKRADRIRNEYNLGVGERSDEITPRVMRSFEEGLPYYMDLHAADPDDFYFDAAISAAPSDIELFRGKYEGKLIIPTWPTPTYIRDVIERSTGNTIFDDLIFDVRLMMHGHLKQVISLNTLKEFARFNNIDISQYDAELEIPFNIDNIEGIDELDDEQYEALTASTGIINVMIQAGGIIVVGESSIPNGIPRGVFDAIGEVKNIDRLDLDEYNIYRKHESNGNDMFNVEELLPYEPPGSLAYYSPIRFGDLQAQALLQEQFDRIVDAIKELFPPLASRAAEISLKLSGIQGNFASQVQNTYGPNATFHKILFDGDSNWIMYKQKNNGKIKEKGNESSMMRLTEKESRILGKMKKSHENDIFFPGRNKLKAWHINTSLDYSKIGETYKYCQISAGLLDKINKKGSIKSKPPGVDPDLVLFSDRMVQALYDAAKDNLEIEEGAKGSAGNNQRYGRPEGRGGDRENNLMKDSWFFRATVAQYVLEMIIDPVTFGQVNRLPVDLLDGTTNSSLWDLAKNADSGLIAISAEVNEITEYISNIDERIVKATTIEEILDIYNTIVESSGFINQFDDDVFAYLGALEDYIKSQETALGKRIVAGVQYIRKDVNYENDKYYIVWPSKCRSAASKYVASGYDSYIPDPPQ